MTYSFRDSFHKFNSSAITPDVAGKELERIHEENGTLRPEKVVDEARPDEAPLHPAFEWDDSVAAEAYRCEQARSMIKTVQVVRQHSEEPRSVPIYVNVGSKESGYEPITKVVSDPDMFEIAFSQACARLSSAQRAVVDLQEVAKSESRPETERYQRAARLLGQAHSIILKGG